MTRFERDLKAAKEGNGIEILAGRKAELERLWKEGESLQKRIQEAVHSTGIRKAESRV